MQDCCMSRMRYEYAEVLNMNQYDESDNQDSFWGEVKKEVINCEECGHELEEKDGSYFCKICNKHFGGKKDEDSG